MPVGFIPELHVFLPGAFDGFVLAGKLHNRIGRILLKTYGGKVEQPVGIHRIQNQSRQSAQDIRAIGYRNLRSKPNRPVTAIHHCLCLETGIPAHCRVPAGRFPGHLRKLLLIPHLITHDIIEVSVPSLCRRLHEHFKRVGVREFTPDGPEPGHHGSDIIVAHHFINHLVLGPIVGAVEYGARFADIQMPAINLALGPILGVAIIRHTVLRLFLCAGHQGREHHHENKNLFHRIMYYSHSEQIEESAAKVSLAVQNLG